MEQYQDGTFGPIQKIDQLFSELFQHRTDVKAIHFGTEEQLEQVKAKAKLEQRVEAIEEKLEIEDLKRRGVIVIPTEEAMKILGLENQGNLKQ